jgi:hypothetical protein
LVSYQTKFILGRSQGYFLFFAPQLQVKWMGRIKRSDIPFGGTPELCVQQEGETLDMEGLHEEPVGAEAHWEKYQDRRPHCSLSESRKKRPLTSSLHKKRTPLAGMARCTFEFLQHLFNFQDFTIELGSIMGSVQVSRHLEGQPLTEFCFDIWHNVCIW